VSAATEANGAKRVIEFFVHWALGLFPQLFVHWALDLFPQLFVHWALGLFPKHARWRDTANNERTQSEQRQQHETAVREN
jgi:hypothetical protein